MTEWIDWSDPVSRLRLLERVGPEVYNDEFQKHLERIVICTVNGHKIRPQGSRFGVLYVVGDTGTAFLQLDRAEECARNMEPGG